ncbi:hypothetical protein L6164_012064 [Bauhinia variegata]|uniref:Uncharacterized protein n=1 Tax=Bauhinia variegata TaxID=167791 RepID=A0ACB9P8T9_BAUVA|nr:hypothetical protein L6164_012064 [Bauhinia variegata]
MELLGPPLPVEATPVCSIINSSQKDTPVETQIIETANLTVDGNPPMGLTENLSATYLSSGNPCLDFFFHVVPDTPASELIQRLQLAWTFDPLLTLKLIFNLRGVRGTGKSDKENFYASALWLHDHHPKTLALNIGALADFGYLKDLPEILYRLHEGLDVRRNAKEQWNNRKKGKKGSRRRSKYCKRRSRRNAEVSEKEVEGILESTEKAVSKGTDKETARKMRKEREIARARRALERYRNDPNYHFLYDCICNFFAELLKSDIAHLSSGEAKKISLAAKWCPSIDSSFDKMTLICEGIARRVFPRNSYPEYEGLEEAHYVYRIRDRLRKQVLVPLHKALELPEIFMSANKWESLRYGRVASVAMKTYKDLFLKHDKERFEDYLEKVKSGKAKIAAGALLPHEIIQSLDDEDGGKVSELQWARMVEDLAKKGELSNCIAVCDVSGSMYGIPMEVSVALGLLVSELSEEPWKGKIITFSENPQLHIIQGDTLKSKTQFIREMEWGANTDFQKVFDRILEVAVEGNLTDDQMIKRVFVFSDMEFDQACSLTSRHNSMISSKFLKMAEEETENSSDRDNDALEETQNFDNDNLKETQNFDFTAEWETDYKVIQRKYMEKGFSNVPEIVFWNLRNSSSTPVGARQNGVAMVSGFSKNIMTLFLEEGGIVNPEQVMGLAVSGAEYKKLAVYD